MLQAAQRGGEGLQLAQFPLGRAVDDLHRAGDLDVNLDPGLVHQLETAGGAGRRAEIGLVLRREFAHHAFAQRVQEARLEPCPLLLKGLDQLEVAFALAPGQARVARVPQQCERTGQHAFDQRAGAFDFVVDELAQLGRSRHAGGL